MENIFSASKPILTLAKLLGLFPMSFEGPARKGLLKLKCVNVIISLFWFVAALFMILNRSPFSKVYTGSSQVLPRAWEVLMNLELFSYIFNFCYQNWKRKNIVKFLKIIHKSDEKVEIYLFDTKCFNFYFLGKKFESLLQL